MNLRRSLIALLISFAGLPAWGQSYQSAIQHDSIFSTNLGYGRYIRVSVPSEYFHQAGKKFNVVYLLDGQSDRLFDLVIANFNYINGDLYSGYPPFIIVAVETDEKRPLEFTPPTKDESTLSRPLFRNGHGNADRYLAFFEEELFPYIEKRYSVTDHKVAIGHSLAGTLLMHALNTNRKMFNAYFLFSPNLAYGDEQLVRKFDETHTDGASLNTFLYVSVGDDENYERRFRDGIKRLDTLLEKIDFDSAFFEVDYLQNCNHYESPQLSLPRALSAYKKLYYYPSPDSLENYLNNKEGFLNQIQKFYNEKTAILGYSYYPSIDIININFAYFALDKDNVDAALEAVNWGIKLYPDDYFSYSLYLTKADVLETRGDIKEAINACEAGLEVLETTKSEMLLEDYQYALEDLKSKIEDLAEQKR